MLCPAQSNSSFAFCWLILNFIIVKMLFQYFIVVSSFLVFQATAQLQLSATRCNATLPRPQGSMGGFHLGYGEDLVFLMGGLNTVRTDTVLRYNISSDSLDLLGRLAIETHDGFTVRIGPDAILGFGGMATNPDPLSPIQLFNLTSGVTTVVGQIEQGYHRVAAVAHVSLSKVLIFGDSWLDPFSTRILELDTTTFSTREIGSLPAGNYYYGAFWTGADEVYLVASQGILKYTISSNTVSEFIHSFPFRIDDFPGVTWDTENIYILGGKWRIGTENATLITYNIAEETVSLNGITGLPQVLDEQFRKGTFVCDQRQRRLYIIGGSTYPGVYRDEIWYVQLPENM